MDLSKLLVLIKMFNNLDDVVVEQLIAVNMGEDMGKQDLQALKRMLPFLKKCDLAGVIDAEYERVLIEDYLKQRGVV
jgi:hypothetical protein